LADIGLADRIFAPHYARPLPRACASHTALVWPEPLADGDPVSQLLPGEDFAVLEYAGGWAWGFCGADHLVGYVEAIALADPIEATHIVREKSAPVTSDDQVIPIIANLPMGARIQGAEAGACLATEYGCVSLAHLRRIGDFEADPVIVAERLLGAPYLPGGRTANGIDAAALVQLAFALCGLHAPRLLDQLAALGAPVPQEVPSRRGDLVLFEGGAGLMIDDLLMIHAGRARGQVEVEPASLYATTRRRLSL